MVNWNLIKCAFNRHKYGDIINDTIFNRTIKICLFCNHQLVVMDNTKEEYKRFQEEKASIIYDINNDSPIHAKVQLDRLVKKLGYNMKDEKT